ncbi:hypothetical protein ABGF34_02075 [Helcococcus ovis]|uniref:hypothetical protein n=2 Tax=Helcococcus ovis TaxID=72026 RepID=UPI0038BDD09B
MKRKCKIGIGIILFVLILLALILFFIQYNNNFYKKTLLNSWGISIKKPYNIDVLYESERGFVNDGQRILKLNSKNFDYSIDCAECYRHVELDSDMKLLSEMIKNAGLTRLIKLKDIKIIDSVKKNKHDSFFFKTLIIIFDENKKIYYIFEIII